MRLRVGLAMISSSEMLVAVALLRLDTAAKDKQQTCQQAITAIAVITMIGLAGVEGSGSGCQLIDGDFGRLAAHNRDPDSSEPSWKKLVLAVSETRQR
jgi:hypothetical protein